MSKHAREGFVAIGLFLEDLGDRSLEFSEEFGRERPRLHTGLLEFDDHGTLSGFGVRPLRGKNDSFVASRRMHGCHRLWKRRAVSKSVNATCS